MLRSLLLYLSERETPKNLLSRSRVGRRMAGRFIAGDSLDNAVRAVRHLNHDGFEATLDHLGEAVTNAEAAEQAAQDYLGLIDCIASESLRSTVSIKLTQLGLAIEEDLALRLLRSIAERARQCGTFVRIDMESSNYVDATLRVFRNLDAAPDTVGIVIQSYLYRSQEEVEQLLKMGARIRLVKGAYREPPAVAFQRKSDVDRNFVRLMKMMLASESYHAIATHDPALISATRDFARARHLLPSRFEFQMLYGIRRDLQRQLLRQGYRVRLYVPYGSEWYPYFMRRLAERPANLFFLLRNLLRG